MSDSIKDIQIAYETSIFGEWGLFDSFYETADDTTWDDLEFFSKKYKSDRWGEHNRLCKGLLYLTDYARKRIGSPLVVLSGTGGTHVKSSQHFLGRAVDLFCPKLSLLDFFLELEKLPWTGIGIYPNMNSIHCDIGIPSDKANRPTRWIGMKIRQHPAKEKIGTIKYFPWNAENFTNLVVNKYWEEKYQFNMSC